MEQTHLRHAQYIMDDLERETPIGHTLQFTEGRKDADASGNGVKEQRESLLF